MKARTLCGFRENLKAQDIQPIFGDSETYQQLTGKPAQTVRDFLFGHKAALTAAA